MEYFQHYIGAHRSPKMIDFTRKTGLVDYGRYFVLLELCTEELKTLKNVTSETDLFFVFDESTLRSWLRLGPAMVGPWLGRGQAMGLLSFSVDGPRIIVRIPNFLESFSLEQRRARHASGKCPPRLEERREEERIKEEIKKKRKEKPKNELRSIGPETALSQDIQIFISQYIKSFQVRYNARPILTGKVQGQIKQFLKDIPLPMALEMIQVYCQMEDPWFIKKCHDFGTFIENLSKVNIGLDTGNEPGVIDPFAWIKEKNQIELISTREEK